MLSKTDIAYLIKQYNPFLEEELKEYVHYSVQAYHELKRLYTIVNYVIGKEEYINALKEKYSFGIASLKQTVNMIEVVLIAKNKKEVKQHIDVLHEKGMKYKPLYEIFLESDSEDKEWKNGFIQF